MEQRISINDLKENGLDFAVKHLERRSVNCIAPVELLKLQVNMEMLEELSMEIERIKLQKLALT